ncbi:hypothetical protein HK104_003485, partial [Borealophlyctis nickersoniae]
MSSDSPKSYADRAFNLLSDPNPLHYLPSTITRENASYLLSLSPLDPWVTTLIACALAYLFFTMAIGVVRGMVRTAWRLVK